MYESSKEQRYTYRIQILCKQNLTATDAIAHSLPHGADNDSLYKLLGLDPSSAAFQPAAAHATSPEEQASEAQTLVFRAWRARLADLGPDEDGDGAAAVDAAARALRRQGTRLCYAREFLPVLAELDDAEQLGDVCVRLTHGRAGGGVWAPVGGGRRGSGGVVGVVGDAAVRCYGSVVSFAARVFG